MFSCEFCNREFQTRSALAGHMRTHGPSNGGYSISRKTGRNYTTYECIQCKKTGSYYSSAQCGKFCGPQCQADYQWETISKPLIENGSCSNKGQLKRYLRESNGDQCVECGQLPIHNNRPLVLQLDHIDGNSDNNAVSNLRLLCPNCHTQTETYGSKNRNGRKKDTTRNNYLRKYQNGNN